MNYNRYKKYIVIDSETGKPMAFQKYNGKEGQFCFCQNDEHRQPFPLKYYSYNKAKILINKSMSFRLKNNYKENGYCLIPVK